MCICVYMFMYKHVYIWKTEVNVGYLPLSFSTLLQRQSLSLTWISLMWLERLASKPWWTHLHFPEEGLPIVLSAPAIAVLRSSRLCGSHLIIWAISPFPQILESFRDYREQPTTTTINKTNSSGRFTIMQNTPLSTLNALINLTRYNYVHTQLESRKTMKLVQSHTTKVLTKGIFLFTYSLTTVL